MKNRFDKELCKKIRDEFLKSDYDECLNETLSQKHDVDVELVEAVIENQWLPNEGCRLVKEVKLLNKLRSLNNNLVKQRVSDR